MEHDGNGLAVLVPRGAVRTDSFSPGIPGNPKNARFINLTWLILMITELF